MTTPVLVTGGAGYVGAQTCKALKRAGFLPVTYDNLLRGFDSQVKWGPLEIGDLGDARRLAAAIAKHQPVAVLHFAGLISVGESTQQPGLYYRVNVLGTWNLLEAMRAARIESLVFSSSAAVYGVPEATPIPETHPTKPLSPYGDTKLIGERMMADYAASGLRAVCLRYFNAAGADPDGEIGELHQPETHLIPLALEAVATGAPMSQYGADYPTPDGTCIRDFVHVADLAEAHVLALKRLLSGGAGGAFNLGTGTGSSIKQVLAAVRAATGRDVPVSLKPRREGDSPSLVADPAKAKRELGWSPARGLAEQVGDAWRWRNRPG